MYAVCLGVVRLWVRKSSKASGWLPEGEGYPVFKTIPTGQPPLAPGKPDSSWQKSVVMNTVRAWFPYMTCSEAEQQRYRHDWEERFSNLPPDGDVNQLAPAFKLPWVELPAQRPLRGPELGTHYLPGSSENPDVNPVTGPGRTAADVHAELLAHQERVKLPGNAANNPNPTILHACTHSRTHARTQSSTHARTHCG